MVDVVVFFTASKKIQVEVPANLAEARPNSAELGYHVQKTLNCKLPEVHEGSSFEFPTGFQIVGSIEEWDLG